jgi:hypothetical protein
VQYLLMIYQAEREEDAPAVAGDDIPTLEEYERFNREYAERGVLRGGAELRPTSSATTVRVRGAEVLLTDGPFAETKEQLAGYYVIECDSLDDAIEIAAAVPGARYGAVEIRPQEEGVGPSTP